MRVALGVGLCVLLAAPVSAQKRDTLPPIDTDRPDFTDGVHTVAPLHIQAEFGLAWVRTRGPYSYFEHGPELLFRIGVSRNLELRSGSTITTRRLPSTGFSETDNDANIGAKIGVAPQHRARPALSIELAVNSPHGFSNPFRDVQPGAALLLGWEGNSPWSLGAELAASRTTGSHGQAIGSASLQYQAAQRTQLYAEYYTIQPLFGESSPAEHYANSGILVRLSNNTQVDARVGTGLNHDANSWFFGFGFAVRFR